MWLIRRDQPSMLQEVSGNPKGYIIDVKLFHSAVRASLNDYLGLIPDPSQSALRSKLWTKMNSICDVRKARGVLYESATDS